MTDDSSLTVQTGDTVLIETGYEVCIKVPIKCGASRCMMEDFVNVSGSYA